jgi:iron complex transport system substrate-binding protein
MIRRVSGFWHLVSGLGILGFGVVMALLGSSFGFAPARANEGGAGPPRVVTMDWTVAATLLALDVVPAGVAQIDAYNAWVRSPEMPPEVTDIGLRTQPNLELLDRMAPDRILIPRFFASLEPVLSRIAPTVRIGRDPSKDAWSQILSATRRIAAAVDREAAAEGLIRRTQTAIRRERATLPETVRPLLIVQFMNATHVRVFGENSLYGSVLKRLGLDNAWDGPSNAWGFSLVSLASLRDVPGRLVIVRPVPVGADPAETAVWPRLPSVKRGDVVRLDPVWSFGGLPAARRFAAQLAGAL